MQRLFSDTDQVTTDPVIDNSLFGNISQLSVDFENSDTRSYDYGELAGSVETPIQVVLFEDCIQRTVSVLNT